MTADGDFFATLKGELISERNYRTHAEAKADVCGYLEGLYNQMHLHSGIGYRTPEQMAAAAMAA